MGSTDEYNPVVKLFEHVFSIGRDPVCFGENMLLRYPLDL